MLHRWKVAALACIFFGCASPPSDEGPAPLSAEEGQAFLKQLSDKSVAQPSARHAAILEAVAERPLVAGNEARLLNDGPATYEAMFKAIAAAKKHINFETYIFENDDVGKAFAEKLIAKRTEGVEVNVRYDSVGSIATDRGFFERLKAEGIKVVEYNPVIPGKRGKGSLNNRDHRKILVIDGKVAFTGGINVSDVYSSGSSSASGSRKSREDGWRDTHIVVAGPVVAEFQKLFVENWREQKGPELESSSFFPALQVQGPHRLRVMPANAGETSEIYRTFLSAINSADTSIHLTMAYFVPDARTIEALTAAANRGVDVTIILPGYSDFWAVFHAGRAHYSALLDAGVRIYERRDALLHAKTAVIDGVWSTVGSSNLDWRSFVHNDEVNAVVLGAEFASEMERMFASDRERATPIEKRAWERRPFSLRVKEQFARLWQYWL
jgi:cardiolipin synthase